MTDHGGDGEMRVRQIVGLPLGSGGSGTRRDPPHRSLHQEASGDQIGKGGLLPHLLAVHGGGTDAGDKTVGSMVGPRRGK